MTFELCVCWRRRFLRRSLARSGCRLLGHRNRKRMHEARMYAGRHWRQGVSLPPRSLHTYTWWHLEIIPQPNENILMYWTRFFPFLRLFPIISEYTKELRNHYDVRGNLFSEFPMQTLLQYTYHILWHTLNIPSCERFTTNYKSIIYLRTSTC